MDQPLSLLKINIVNGFVVNKWILCTVLIGIFMPFFSRIPGGSEWVNQYLPSSFSGFIFHIVFGVLSTAPVVFAFLLSKRIGRKVGIVMLFFSGVFLTIAHYQNDLSLDAQSSVILVVIPIVSFLGNSCFLILSVVGSRLWQRRFQSSNK